AQQSLMKWQNLKHTLQIQKSSLQQELIKAQEQLTNFKVTHSQQKLRSSVSGVVFNVNNQQGELIKADDPIMLVGIPNQFKLELLIDSRDIQKVQNGQSVLFKTDAFPGQQFQ